MKPDDWCAYIDCIKAINAEERLEDITTSTFADLKSKSRQNVAKKYRKDAASLTPKKKLSMKEAMEKLNGR